MSLNKEVGALLKDSEGWEKGESALSEEEIVAAIAFRVSEMLSGHPEEFFGLMYRLDIPELKLQEAIHAADPAVAVAALVWARQLQRQASRKARAAGPEESDPELSW